MTMLLVNHYFTIAPGPELDSEMSEILHKDNIKWVLHVL